MTNAAITRGSLPATGLFMLVLMFFVAGAVSGCTPQPEVADVAPSAQGSFEPRVGPDRRTETAEPSLPVNTVVQGNRKPVAETTVPPYTYREEHDRFGTGKFYMGREIAPVVGHAEIQWIERPEREQQEKLSLLIKALDLKPGMVVADIGAGSGVISLLMAAKLAPQGEVVAVDVQQAMLDRLAEKLKRQNVTNVRLVKGTSKSPQLQPASVDVALMVDVYHEFEFPFEMMQAIARSVKPPMAGKPGGRVVLVEYRTEDPRVPIKQVHKMTEAQVKQEIARPEFGLTWKKTIEVLPWQHIVIFERIKPAKDESREPATRDRKSQSSSLNPQWRVPVPGRALRDARSNVPSIWHTPALSSVDSEPKTAGDL